MKKTLILSTLITLFLFSAVFAQEIQPKRKLVFINTTKFEDEKSGVEKLVAALKTVKNLSFNDAYADARDKAEYQMKRRRLVDPVRKEIAVFLKEIETQNNLMILDVAELDSKGQILALNNALDISSFVIESLNEYFKTQKIVPMTFNLPEAKIAAVNTRTLLDEKDGLNRVKEKAAATRALIRKETGKDATIEQMKQYFIQENPQNNIITDVFNHLYLFVEKRGFNLVLDSSSRLPTELKDFPVEDVTKDFISYYNQLNP